MTELETPPTDRQPGHRPALTVPPAEVALVPPVAAPSPAVTAGSGRPQLIAMFGQFLGGAGNLAVGVVLLGVLPAAGYAQFVAFTGLYVLIHMVAASLSAPVAMDPARAAALRRRTLLTACAVGALVAVTAPVTGDWVGIDPWGLVLLGCAVPSAALLALARGRLYGGGGSAGIAATLVTEPLARALVGIALVPVLGPVGAMAAVVAAGYLAWAVALPFAASAPARAGSVATGTAAVTLSFLVVALIAALDVIIANRVLPGEAAGIFAAVATLGGAAYFATATVPMVLLPRSSAGEQVARPAFRLAVAVAVGVGSLAVLVTALLPPTVFAAVLGPRFTAIGPLAIGYVLAMALLGSARVLVARLAMLGRSPVAVVIAVAAAGLQLALLLDVDTPGDAVRATLIACAVLVTGCIVALLGAPGTVQEAPVVPGATVVLPRPRSSTEMLSSTAEPVRDLRLAVSDRFDWRREGPVVGLIVVLAATLRLIVTRSIWLDEAISIQQAQQTFPDMIEQLQQNDVHPPLFAVILWAVVHLTGDTGEFVVRLPSMIVGILVVAIGYAMARDLWDVRTARIAGLVFAVAPVMVWYSQEARMYMFWVLFALLAAWAQLRILRRGRGSLAEWTTFVLSTVALLYTQWFALLPILVQHLVFAAALLSRSTPHRGALARRWGMSVLASLALFAPLLPYLWVQAGSVLSATSAAGTPGQTGSAASSATGTVPDVYAVLANAIWSVWGYHSDAAMISLGALWPAAMLLVLASLGRGRTRTVTVLLMIGVVPALLLFVVGFQRRQLFELRYFTSLVPMVLLVLARMAASWGRGPIARVLLPLTIVASLVLGLVDQQINKSNPRVYDFRAAAQYVNTEGTAQDITVYAPSFLKDEIAYYAPRTSITVASTFVPGRIPDLAGRRIFVLGSFLDQQGVSAQVGKVLADLQNSGWEQRSVQSFANVTVWEFQENT
ncbi:MAG: glycosyltransferase family 39 protein [Nakamurella sp.]